MAPIGTQLPSDWFSSSPISFGIPHWMIHHISAFKNDRMQCHRCNPWNHRTFWEKMPKMIVLWTSWHRKRGMNHRELRDENPKTLLGLRSIRNLFQWSHSKFALMDFFNGFAFFSGPKLLQILLLTWILYFWGAFNNNTLIFLSSEKFMHYEREVGVDCCFIYILS